MKCGFDDQFNYSRITRSCEAGASPCLGSLLIFLMSVMIRFGCCDNLGMTLGNVKVTKALKIGQMGSNVIEMCQICHSNRMRISDDIMNVL